ncbi:hypothetical protein V8G54_003800 [Vigna mungo]|uniref:GTP-eEF1A C-terminal domain-containing protein n=1 Tax=Vigna mungo TaxID=3915 RepID=A0AAQ3PAM9_VIGMU
MVGVVSSCDLEVKSSCGTQIGLLKARLPAIDLLGGLPFLSIAHGRNLMVLDHPYCVAVYGLHRAVNNSICIEKFSDFPQLGRFTLRTEGKTVAVGKVTGLTGIRAQISGVAALRHS